MIDAALNLALEQLPGSPTSGLPTSGAQIPSATGLDVKTMAASEVVADQIGAAEWLGPLAPIAMSPFFGLTILSGVATYGPDWLQDRSALFADSSSLNNPWLFWIMLILALLSSLPRLTKVSKPIALAAEKLETYSAVIILFVVRFSSGDESIDLTSPEVSVLTAGFASFSLDFVMALFAALNVVVVNAVKLFFEFLVWLIPFPTIDAIVEAANKSVCAGLMGLYCFSPVLATMLNLLLVLICILIFGWTQRRLHYYRNVVVTPWLARLMPQWFAQKGELFIAFVVDGFQGIPKFSRVYVQKIGESEFKLKTRWLWRSVEVHLVNCTISQDKKLVGYELRLLDKENHAWALAHRSWVPADSLYEAKQQVEAEAGLVG